MVAAAQLEFTTRWPRAAAAGLTFRPMTDADLPFLAGLYASTRVAELAPVPWSEADKAAFCEQQFCAQHLHYQEHYAGAEWLVISRHEGRVGRLYLVRWPTEHRLIDIAFLPQHCGQGLGTALLTDLQDEAAAARKPLTIHVEQFNPALRLYARLGFVKADVYGVYDLMRWTPGAARSPSS